MLTAIYLARTDPSLEIVIINSDLNFGTGIAYHPHSDKYCLNVVAGKMSLYVNEPDHFVRWLAQQDLCLGIEVEILRKSYLPRKIYGEYLKSEWKKTKKIDK